MKKTIITLFAAFILLSVSAVTASAAGLTHTVVRGDTMWKVASKYEVGTNDIPTQILIRLARFYNVSIDYLLGETDNPHRYE